MSDVSSIKMSNGLLIKPQPAHEAERIAKLREYQKRERKEKLYSSGTSNF